MFVFLSFFALLYLSKSNEEVLDGMQDVYHSLFPNISSKEDLFLKKPEDGKTTPTATSKPNTAPAPDDDFDSLLKFSDIFKLNQAEISNHSFDILDFLDINAKHSNITKEYKRNIEILPNDTIRVNNTRRFQYYDPDDYAHNDFSENVKRRQLMMVMVQFVMHCRYEVGKALIHRDLVRQDKRYKLGYLFNRMRRLKTEQLKMVATSREMIYSNYWYMYTQIRLYERVVHFDVDMRDTAALIRAIFAVEAPYDKVKAGKG